MSNEIGETGPDDDANSNTLANEGGARLSAEPGETAATGNEWKQRFLDKKRKEYSLWNSKVEKLLKREKTATPGTALHVLATAGFSSHYLKKASEYLISVIEKIEDLLVKDERGSTLLANAVRHGKEWLVRSLIEKNKKLLAEHQDHLHLLLTTVPDANEKIPVQLACESGNKDLTKFLYIETPSHILRTEKGEFGFHLIKDCISKEMFDIALHLLYYIPELALYKSLDNSSILLSMAQFPPSPFSLKNQLPFWSRWIRHSYTTSDQTTGENRMIGLDVFGSTLGIKWKICSILQPANQSEPRVKINQQVIQPDQSEYHAEANQQDAQQDVQANQQEHHAEAREQVVQAEQPERSVEANQQVAQVNRQERHAETNEQVVQANQSERNVEANQQVIQANQSKPNVEANQQVFQVNQSEPDVEANQQAVQAYQFEQDVEANQQVVQVDQSKHDVEANQQDAQANQQEHYAEASEQVVQAEQLECSEEANQQVAQANKQERHAEANEQVAQADQLDRNVETNQKVIQANQSETDVEVNQQVAQANKQECHAEANEQVVQADQSERNAEANQQVIQTNQLKRDVEVNQQVVQVYQLKRDVEANQQVDQPERNVEANQQVAQVDQSKHYGAVNQQIVQVDQSKHTIKANQRVVQIGQSERDVKANQQVVQVDQLERDIEANQQVVQVDQSKSNIEVNQPIVQTEEQQGDGVCIKTRNILERVANILYLWISKLAKFGKGLTVILFYVPVILVAFLFDLMLILCYLVCGIPVTLLRFVLRISVYATVIIFRTVVNVLGIKRIHKLKLDYYYANEILNLIWKRSEGLSYHKLVQNGAIEANFLAIKNHFPDIPIGFMKKHEDKLRKCSDSKNPEENMFAMAVIHRQEKIARFLFNLDIKNAINIIDKDGNNLLRLAAKLAPDAQLAHKSGAALQLQSELHWFKAVESIVPSWLKASKNIAKKKTPFELFVEEHKGLQKEAEEWIKKAAESSTVVGGLIITIMFAAAFTVPGGNNQETGLPIFSKMAPFLTFIIADSISLFAAVTSVLMFLGILTSRYALEDFVKSLPMKLILGASALFISIAAMMVAFCAALFIMLQGQSRVVVPIVLLAGVPVASFVLLQFPLLVQILKSTNSPGIFEVKEEIGWELEWDSDEDSDMDMDMCKPPFERTKEAWDCLVEVFEEIFENL